MKEGTTRTVTVPLTRFVIVSTAEPNGVGRRTPVFVSTAPTRAPTVTGVYALEGSPPAEITKQRAAVRAAVGVAIEPVVRTLGYRAIWAVVAAATSTTTATDVKSVFQ